MRSLLARSSRRRHNDMKYRPHIYAKALDAALANPKANDARVAKRFLEVVRRNGDEASLPKILEEAARFARGRGGARKVIIESARTLGASQETMIKKFLTPGDVVVRKIDPGLIAGVRITVNDERQFDGSMRAKLDALFATTA